MRDVRYEFNFSCKTRTVREGKRPLGKLCNNERNRNMISCTFDFASWLPFFILFQCAYYMYHDKAIKK